MTSGLSNTPATYQRALDMVLTRLKWKKCLVYMDSVIIYSKYVEEHIDHADEILNTLAEAGVNLKMNK